MFIDKAYEYLGNWVIVRSPQARGLLRRWWVMDSQNDLFAREKPDAEPRGKGRRVPVTGTRLRAQNMEKIPISRRYSVFHPHWLVWYGNMYCFHDVNLRLTYIVDIQHDLGVSPTESWPMFYKLPSRYYHPAIITIPGIGHRIVGD